MDNKPKDTTILPYPKILPFADVKELHRKFVYVIKNYSDIGFAIVVVREAGDIFVKVGDFNGKTLDPNSKIFSQQLGDVIQRLLALTRTMQIRQVVYYLADDAGTPRLVDLRLSLNKFSGPGFIKDIFGKYDIPTQEVFKIIQLDETTVDSILAGKNGFSDSYIIKPSAFKHIVRDKDALPMYGRIVR